MRTLRQDYVSIPLSSGCSILRRIVLQLAAIWICPLAIRNGDGPPRLRNVTACRSAPHLIRLLAGAEGGLLKQRPCITIIRLSDADARALLASVNPRGSLVVAGPLAFSAAALAIVDSLVQAPVQHLGSGHRGVQPGTLPIGVGAIHRTGSPAPMKTPPAPDPRVFQARVTSDRPRHRPRRSRPCGHAARGTSGGLLP